MNEHAEHPEEDPIAEVRRWRAKLVREVGGTLEGLIALLPKAGDEERDERSEEGEKSRRKSA